MAEWIHLRAPNDVNGNPRRLYVELADSRISRVIDEGYKGTADARTAGMGNYATTIEISATEYKAFKKMDPDPVDETYQGYRNFETFSVDLMLSNDSKMYDDVTELVTKHGRTLDCDDALRDYVYERAGVERVTMSAVGAQLINCAMARVDWRELVNLWADRIEEG